MGTPAVTTRGMKEAEMKEIAELIDQTLKAPADESHGSRVREKVEVLTKKFPLYSELLDRD